MAKDQPKKDEPKDADEPRSYAVFDRGIRTDDDFTNAMSALMSDLIRGRIPPSVGNAACNTGGKMLKAVELKYKYGTTSRQGNPKTLILAPVQCPGCGKTVAGNALLPAQERESEYCDDCKRKTLPGETK